VADQDRTIRLFQRAASQRLTAAEFLLEHGFFLDSIYLAGYAVECSFKALILRRTPRSQWKAVYNQLTKVGAKGHDYEYLLGLLKKQMNKRDKRDREVFGKINEQLLNVISWSTTLRYEVGSIEPKVARVFLQSATEICPWCVRS
jgi:HEPN domain-containing protein